MKSNIKVNRNRGCGLLHLDTLCIWYQNSFEVIFRIFFSSSLRCVISCVYFVMIEAYKYVRVFFKMNTTYLLGEKEREREDFL